MHAHAEREDRLPAGRVGRLRAGYVRAGAELGELGVLVLLGCPDVLGQVQLLPHLEQGVAVEPVGEVIDRAGLHEDGSVGEVASVRVGEVVQRPGGRLQAKRQPVQPDDGAVQLMQVRHDDDGA